MLQCKTSVPTPKHRVVPPRPHGFVVIAACFALAGLTACGQKGPLIAPKPATAASAPASR
ncbi:MAG TPA: lipoprotein [Piscinibacter sp.]|jgi:hypothetical protein|nr:lipoprotein [Piscinibacter sp.]MBP6542286.1 lipoprotein [Piscinibacter sp.]HPG81268.1 lipoprotein [Piscinibacter sp.]